MKKFFQKLLKRFKKKDFKETEPQNFQIEIDKANAAEARYTQHNDIQGLNEAIEIWEGILNHPEFDNIGNKFCLQILNYSAITYVYRYQAIGKLADLDTSISYWQKAVKLTPDDSPDLPKWLNNLGNGIRERYACNGKLADLENSILYWQKAVKLTPYDSPDLPTLLNNLGLGLSNRYTYSGELADLENSILYSQKAVKLTPENSPDLPKWLNSLGNVLSNQYTHSGELADLENSILYFQKAVKLTPEDSPSLPSLLHNLGLGLSNRYAHSGELADLENSILYLQKAVKLTHDDSPSLPYLLNSLGLGLSNRYAHSGDLADLENSILYSQKAVKLTPDDSPDLPLCLNNLAVGFRDCYTRSGKLADLENNISYLQKVVKLTPDDSPDLPSSLNNLGLGLRDSYAHSGELTDLENSISYSQKAVKLTPKDSPDLPKLINSLAVGFSELYTRRGELADLENSISYSQKAVKLTPENSPYLPSWLNNLAIGFRNRYAYSGELTDLENSISYSQKALKLTSEDSPDLSSWFNNLAVGLSDRYARSGKLEDLENSISYSHKAVKLTTKDSPDLPSWFNSLATGLSDRYARSGELVDLENSISYLQKAVKLTSEDSPSLPSWLNNLGLRLSDRYVSSGELADLENSILYLQKAVKLSSEDSPSLPSLLNNLGLVLSYRYSHSGELADLENSILHLQKAVKMTPEDSPNLPECLNNLGLGLNNRYASSGELADLEQGKQAFQQAAQKGSEIALETGLNSAKNWLQWAFERQSWQEVTQAYSYVYKSATRLVQTQLLRQHQESYLKDIQGLVAYAAYAYAKTEQFELTAVMLERGLAQLLSETLSRERADLEDLKSLQQDLYQAYKEAIEAWQQAHKLADTEKLKAARQKLDTTIAAIREIKGYEDFLAVPEFKDITIAAKNTTLVYLLTTNEGGLALIVSDNEVKPLWLQQFTSNLFGEKLYDYFEKYFNWRNTENNEQSLKYKEQWCKSLEEITAWLWSSIMESLIEALPKEANCTLIPTGYLGLLPLHAAWKTDNTKPTGKYYALDALTINYAPNARSLYAAQKIAAKISPDNLLAIQEPFLPDKDNPSLPDKDSKLPHTQYEAKTIISHFFSQQYKLIKNKKATRAAIIEALPNYNVLHFSGHGFADLENPAKSGLVMANNEPLTLEDLLKLRLKGIRLVTLSACETGLAGLDLPDEVVNLPTGLLQAGVAGVAASLWTVADLSTMMLISYFYDLWRIEKLEPVQALRQAQIWMRDTTDAEKLKYFKYFSTYKSTVRMAKATAIHLSNNMSNSHQQTYKHPYHWAAFGFVGL